MREIKKYVPQALNGVKHLSAAENENKRGASMGKYVKWILYNIKYDSNSHNPIPKIVTFFFFEICSIY